MPDSTICVIGDTHGHLQLALGMAARWQQELGLRFESVFLCGDVGSFTEDSQLDSTTRRHAKTNPCELEFLHQWAAEPQPRWLQTIFRPEEEGGLGLTCPVVMVHGNHEGFAHLETLLPVGFPEAPVAIGELPGADTGGRIRYLPSGWQCRTDSGVTVAGLGGIERGQRRADYHELAYLDELAVLYLMESKPADLLITHQGPSRLQGDGGSPTLDALIDAMVAKYWFHGHSVRNDAIQTVGRDPGMTVVPLHDVAFPMRGPNTDEPGVDGWSYVTLEDGTLQRTRPDFWREFRKRKWKETADGRLIAPPLSD